MANLATINNNILADSGIDPLSLIVGTGTVNYVPKFTAEDTVANSQIFDNGTDVGIGTSSPFVKFDVRGEAMLLYRPAGNAYAIYSAANNTYSWQFGINNGSDYVICGGGFTGLGVEAFRITLGGNVGIGTTSPVTKLDVNGAGVIRGFLTTTDAIKLGGNTSAPTSTDAFIYRPADNTLAFGTASAERMRLDVSGNLLIGLSSALANGKLQVAGSIGLSGNTQIRQATNSDGNTLQVFATQVIAGNLNSYSYGYSGGGLLASVSAGDSILLFDAGRTTSTEGRVKIANTTLGNVSFSVEKNGVTTLFASTLGNVGIGSANPQVKLDVQSGSIGAYHNTASSGGAQLYLGDMNFAGGAYATSAPGVGAVYGPTHLVAGDLAFYVYNGVASSRSEAMRIIRHSSGNNYVGIGTTTPTTKLHVLSSDNTYANLVIAATSNNGNVTGGLTFGGLYNSDALNFYTGASSTTKMYISNAGNVGIGTTSPANIGTGYTTLDIQGTNGGGMAFGTATKSYIYGAATMYLEANTTLLMTTSGSERMRITSGGSVGIGTSSPQARLQVTNSTSDGIIVSTTANVEPFLAFWRNSASNGVGVLRLIDGGNLYFDNGATGAAQSTKMQLAATGAVRINSYGAGSFTGTVAYNLAVDASGNIIETAGGVVDGSGTANYISKWSDPNTLTNSIIYDNGTNVGIYLSAPTQRLSIRGNQVFTNQDVDGVANALIAQISSQARGYSNQDANMASIQFRTNSAAWYKGEIAFLTNDIDGTDPTKAATERMRITSAGNVGIGTTSPEAKLDVFGSSSDQIRLRTAASEYYRIGRNASTGYLDFWGSQSGYVGYTWSGVNGERMRLDSSGNLGLGVVPSAFSSSYKAIQFGTTGSIFGESGDAANYYTTNTFIDAGGFKYITTDFALGYFQENGVHSWRTAPSGTAGNAISFTQAMTLTSSGDLYVGGTTDSYSEANRRVLSLNGGTNALISFRASGSALGYIYAYSTALDIAAVNRSITFSAGVGPAERMRITSSGDVGIGTSSPGDKLQVDGNVYANAFHAVGSIARFVSGGGTFIAGLNGSSYGYIQSYSDTSGTGRALAINPSGGNVGIGTTSPTAKLHTYLADGVNDNRLLIQQGSSGYAAAINLNGANDAGSAYNYINSGTTGGTAMWQIGGGGVSNTMIMYTAGNERMRITSGGNVGIGTSSPDAIFHVARPNAGGVGGQVVIDNNAGSTLGNTAEISFLTDAGASGAGTRNARIQAVNENVGNGAANMQFWTWNGSAEAERMRITSGGDILVAGTYNPYTAANRGNITLNGTSGVIGFANGTTPRGFIFHDGTNLEIANSLSNPILFATAGNERMRITSGGLVGIGTSSPSDTLHVTGSVRSNSGSSYEVTNHGTFTLNDGTLGNYVDFLVVGSTNVGSSFVELTLSETNIGHGSIKYFIPTNYDDVYVSQTRVVLPLYTTNPRFGYAGGGYGSAIQELQIIANNTGNYTLRLVVRKVGNGSAPAWYWTAKLKNCAVSSTPNTTGINSTAYSLYRHTPLMQYDNKVGIGTAQPSATLNVVSAGNAAYTCIVTEDNARRLKIGRDQISAYDLSENPAQLYIQGNGSNVAMVTAGGNVGIGTSGPSYKLDVVGTTARVRDAGNVNYVSLSIYGGVYLGGNGTGGVRYAGTETNDNFALVANNSEKVRITTGGYVGIGTSNPTCTLDVRTDSGVLVKGATSDIDGRIALVPASGGRQYGLRNYGSSFGIKDESADVIRMYFHYDGNTGIGTTSPSYKLDVVGNIASNAGTNEAQVFVKNSTSSIYLFNSYAGNTFGIFDGTAGQHRMYYDRGSNFWTFYTGASERMRITSGGDVGIGTSNPAGILDVITNNSATQLVRFYNSNTSGTGASAVRIGNGGNNNDGARLEFSDNNYYVATISGDRSQGIVFRTSATGNNPITIPERMRITSGGNVFVGSQNTLGLSLQRLTVTEDSSAAFLGIYRNNTAISQEQGGIQWMNGGAGTSIAKIAVNTSSDFTDTGNLLFFTKSSGSSQSEKMRITSGGNVLMGTTSDAGYKLDVTGTLRVNGNNNTAVALTVNGSDASEGLVAKFARGASEKNFYISATNNQYVNLATEGNFRFKTGISVNQPYTSGNDPMVLTSTGNVGIGTSSPTVKLQVSGTTLFEGGYANFLASGTIALRIGADGSNDIFMPSGRNLSISAEDNILFRTSGALTERFRITSSGNVGIGTSSPSGQLEVYEGFYKRLFVSYPNSTTTRLSIGHNFYIDNDQSPEITSFTNSSGTSIFRWLQGSTPTERMRLSPSGNLLIGTTSDAGQKLQVNGNGYFNGNLETTVDLVLSRTDVAPAIVTVNGNLRLYKSSGAGAQYSLSYDNDTITFSGSIKTGTPSGGTAVPWKLGSRITNTCGTPDTYAGFTSQFLTDKVIEVEINGVTVYIPTVTPGWC